MTDAQETAADTALRTTGGAPPDDGVAAEEAPIPLLEPREGIPPVVADADGARRGDRRLRRGHRPVAVDAERASGYRYGQRAYLVQLRREGAGSALIDPVGCPDLSALGDVLSGAEWILHAATQDLPCLREIGMIPTRLFDTELAGRLAGFPRVGLGAMVECVLGFALEKGHSAVDWSTRPLPEPWLRYAALDVELLVDLRDALEKELDRQGKLDWALQEFDAIASAPPAPPRKDPWRRTSGHAQGAQAPPDGGRTGAVDHPRQVAQRRDVSPGKVLSDSAIVEAALALPLNVQALTALPGFGHRMGRRQLEQWQAAVDRAKALPESELPQPGQPVNGPPPPRSWADKDPEAAARLSAARAAVSALAEELNLPQENLITPDTVRRVCWEPPAELSVAAVADALAVSWRPRLAGRAGGTPADARPDSNSDDLTPRHPSPAGTLQPRRRLRRGARGGAPQEPARPVGPHTPRARPQTPDGLDAPAHPRCDLRRSRPWDWAAWLPTSSMAEGSARLGACPQQCHPAPWRRAIVPRTVRDVVFVDGVRTPFGKAGPKGIYHETRADDLVVKAIRELLRRNPDLDPAKIDEVAIAATTQIGDQGLTLGRTAGILAGLPQSVPGYSIDRMCAGALTAVTAVAGGVAFGAYDVAVAGGVEHMGRHPMGEGVDPNPRFVSEKLVDESALFMGMTAENLHDRYPHITKQRADEYAVRSQEKAAKAYANGKIQQDLVPISVRRTSPEAGETGWGLVTQDEPMRPGTTLENLTGLKTPFRVHGRVTAGNAAGLNDGATASLIASEDFARENNLPVKMRLVSYAFAGVEPEVMGYGPIPATEKALAKAGLSIEDINLFEINEAFAVQVLALLDHYGIADDDPRVNQYGGAIAFGHPLASSGVRLMTQLARQFEEQPEVRYGLTTMCVGFGMGATVIWENPHHKDAGGSK